MHRLSIATNPKKKTKIKEKETKGGGEGDESSRQGKREAHRVKKAGQ
jgi:hypothetical protein